MNLQKLTSLARFYCKENELFASSQALVELKKINERIEINPFDKFDKKLNSGVYESFKSQLIYIVESEKISNQTSFL